MTGPHLHHSTWTIRDGRCQVLYILPNQNNDNDPHHHLRHHCAIEDDEEVVLTGGSDTWSLVTRYNVEGEATTLPSLITGRHSHACGRVTTADLETVSLGS